MIRGPFCLTDEFFCCGARGGNQRNCLVWRDSGCMARGKVRSRPSTRTPETVPQSRRASLARSSCAAGLDHFVGGSVPTCRTREVHAVRGVCPCPVRVVDSSCFGSMRNLGRLRSNGGACMSQPESSELGIRHATGSRYGHGDRLAIGVRNRGDVVPSPGLPICRRPPFHDLMRNTSRPPMPAKFQGVTARTAPSIRTTGRNLGSNARSMTSSPTE